MRNPLEKLPVTKLKAWDSSKQKYVTVLVDGDYDGEYFSQFRWSVNPGGYVILSYSGAIESDKTGAGKRVKAEPYLHKMVLPPKKGFWVHHLNGDKLDNRSANLAHRTPQFITQKREDDYRDKNHGQGRLQTHCKRGHLLAGDNLYVLKNGPKTGRRWCALCQRIRTMEYYQRKRLERWKERNA